MQISSLENSIINSCMLRDCTHNYHYLADMHGYNYATSQNRIIQNASIMIIINKQNNNIAYP